MVSKIGFPLLSALFCLSVSTKVFSVRVSEPQLDAPAPQSHKILPPAAAARQVLSGVVRLESALTAEQQVVDWYGWYMACRQYLMQTGGIACEVGTPIVFYKHGLVRAKSDDLACQHSVRMKWFPLPSGTSAEAIMLTTRSGVAPPASAEELREMLEKTP